MHNSSSETNAREDEEQINNQNEDPKESLVEAQNKEQIDNLMTGGIEEITPDKKQIDNLIEEKQKTLQEYHSYLQKRIDSAQKKAQSEDPNVKLVYLGMLCTLSWLRYCSSSNVQVEINKLAKLEKDIEGYDKFSPKQKQDICKDFFRAQTKHDAWVKSYKYWSQPSRMLESFFGLVEVGKHYLSDTLSKSFRKITELKDEDTPSNSNGNRPN